MASVGLILVAFLVGSGIVLAIGALSLGIQLVMQTISKIFVGIPQTDFSFIGTLDTINIPPSAEGLKLVYVDLADGRFVVALEEGLIYRTIQNNN